VSVATLLSVSFKMRFDGRLEVPRVVRKSESPGVNVRGQTKTTFSDPNEIARTQLVRFKRRLGALTNEQELQIENLLSSTITKISLMTGRVMESLSEDSRRKAVSAIESKYIENVREGPTSGR